MECINYARPEPISWLISEITSRFSFSIVGASINQLHFHGKYMQIRLPNAHSYMFRKIGPNETKSDTGILMELHETLQSELCPLTTTR